MAGAADDDRVYARLWRQCLFMVIQVLVCSRAIYVSLSMQKSAENTNHGIPLVDIYTVSANQTHYYNRWPIDTETAPPFSIFYNVFTPRNDTEGRQRSQDIFREQMKQISTSYAATSFNRTVTIFYNTIGDPDAITDNFVEQICHQQHHLHCHHMRHYDKGFEDVTLQRVYEYCHDFPQNRVVYLHNKGSYRYVYYQEGIRRKATDAVTSEFCLNPPDNQCNVCGEIFFPTWGPFLTANFFTAKCQYVQRLLPPVQIETKMTLVHTKFLQMQNNSAGPLLDSNILEIGPHVTGQGRYSHEHWVAGHPDVQPCDTCSANNNKTMAPCDQLHSRFWYGVDHNARRRVLRQEHLRMRDYFLLPGYLFRWFELYGQVPANTSWVWEWFPDGNTWRDAVHAYGPQKAVYLLTSRHVPNNPKKRIL